MYAQMPAHSVIVVSDSVQLRAMHPELVETVVITSCPMGGPATNVFQLNKQALKNNIKSCPTIPTATFHTHLMSTFTTCAKMQSSVLCPLNLVYAKTVATMVCPVMGLAKGGVQLNKSPAQHAFVGVAPLCHTTCPICFPTYLKCTVTLCVAKKVSVMWPQSLYQWLPYDTSQILSSIVLYVTAQCITANTVHGAHS